MIKDELVRPYTKVMMAVDTASTPSAVVMPPPWSRCRGGQDLQRAQDPVWTISTGRNFGYGSAAPGQRGQVVLDLRKMNKIIHVDPELCTALVEPGVTYQSSTTTSKRTRCR
jgi:4-cresol dehydrogenase (hydroxylating)